MAKIIYAIKIYLLRYEFSLTSIEKRSLKEFIKFILQIYLEAWFTSRSATMAGFNDLKMAKEIVNYENVNKAISSVALKSFTRHLWYLSEPLIGLAFFDDRIDVNEKRKMVK